MTRQKLFTTRIDIPEASRDQLVPLLNQHVADTFDLYSQVKQAHWNVKGREFYQLHELFDSLAETLESYIDLLAERATTLGGTALGTVRVSATASRLPDLAVKSHEGRHYLAALADHYAALAASARAAINFSTEQGDASTADLFTEISRGLDKSLWSLEAHLQE